jgi:hypothetical protein
MAILQAKPEEVVNVRPLEEPVLGTKRGLIVVDREGKGRHWE